MYSVFQLDWKRRNFAAVAFILAVQLLSRTLYLKLNFVKGKIDKTCTKTYDHAMADTIQQFKQMVPISSSISIHCLSNSWTNSQYNKYWLYVYTIGEKTLYYLFITVIHVDTKSNKIQLQYLADTFINISCGRRTLIKLCIIG